MPAPNRLRHQYCSLAPEPKGAACPHGDWRPPFSHLVMDCLRYVELHRQLLLRHAPFQPKPFDAVHISPSLLCLLYVASNCSGMLGAPPARYGTRSLPCRRAGAAVFIENIFLFFLKIFLFSRHSPFFALIYQYSVIYFNLVYSFHAYPAFFLLFHFIEIDMNFYNNSVLLSVYRIVQDVFCRILSNLR